MAFLTWLGLSSPVALGVLLFTLAKLSERFGSVVKMNPHFRYYYIGVALIVVSSLTHALAVFVQVTAAPGLSWLAKPWFWLLAYHLPQAVGVTIGLAVTWYYWRWLVTEQN